MASMDAPADAFTGIAPAPLGPRIAAGAFDAVALGLLSAGLSLSPLFFGGFALPLLGSLTAILVYTILPCSLFKGTLGLRIFGLEMVGADGRAPEPGEVAFRELVTRGYFGIAYFSTAAIAVAGYLSGTISFFQPTGIGLVLFFLSGFLLLLSAIGHLMILIRPDRRGFPDLVAKTAILRRGAVLEPGGDELDAEERADFAKRKSQRAIKFGIFAAGLLVATVFVPHLLTRAGEGKEDLPERWRLDEAERKWKKDPANVYLASDVVDRLEARGDIERAEAVRSEHLLALGEQKKVQETALLASLDREPTDWDTVTTLLEIYSEQNNTAAGIRVWEKYLGAEKSPDMRASFGVWLYQNDENDRAVAELKAALAAGSNGPDVHAYLGMAYKELGKKEEARAELSRALELDPELDEVAGALDELVPAEEAH
jgi:uncharacterized RDD family membrane protein YckC